MNIVKLHSKYLFKNLDNSILRKIFFILIIILCLNTAKAYNYRIGSYTYELNESNQTAILVKGSSDGMIPETVNWSGTDYTVTEIGFGAFSDQSLLGTLRIPNTIKKIGGIAFKNCKRLKYVVIPNSVEHLDWDIFMGCNLEKIIVLGNIQTCSATCFTDCGLAQIYVLSPNLTNYADNIKRIISLQNSRYICGFSDQFSFNDYPELGLDINSPTEYTVEILDMNEKVINSYTFDFNEKNTVKDLEAGASYYIRYTIPMSNYNLSWTKKSDYSYNLSDINYKRTQTTLKINSLNLKTDETFEPSEIECYIEGIPDYKIGETIEDLWPDSEFKLHFKAKYSDIFDPYIFETSIRTLNLYPHIYKSEVGPTSVKLESRYNQGDAKINNTFYTYKNEKISNPVIVEGVSKTSDYIIENSYINGLTPGKKYNNILYNVEVINNKGETKIYTEDLGKYQTRGWTTNYIQFDLGNAKNINNTSAILAASTNIMDAETAVGFQWRKSDAPSSMPWNEGNAVIWDGMLEGVVHNLQPSSFYDFRAFYRDIEGNYYYSNVLSFDPSDFSYFEPTVKTFDPILNETEIILRGYALEGSDPIISQGFQYWRIVSERSRADQDSVSTIEVPGQIMKISLSDLPSGRYLARAFVQTYLGFTYGEEISFSFESSDVEKILDYEVERTIIGYYDLSGRFYNKPIQGLNIVIFNDGSTQKIIFK